MKKIGQKIIDWLIPHEGNNHKPLLFCEVGLATVALVVLMFFGLGLVGKMSIDRDALPASVQSLVLVDLANKDRDQNDISALTVNPVLVAAAQMKADDMVKNGYFAHTSPAGVTPWYWFGQAGYKFIYAGENLAIDFSESADVNEAWMESPLHRQNILNGNFTEIGVATAEGIYKGERTTFVVQLFASPASSVTKVTPKIETAKEVAIVEDATVSPSVAGESIEVEEEYLPLYTSVDYVAVKNVSASNDQPVSSVDSPVVEESEMQNVENDEPSVLTAASYTTVFQRMMASPSNTISTIYLVIFVGRCISLLLMIFIEIKKQHHKSILLGVFALMILLILAYLTKEILFQSVSVL